MGSAGDYLYDWESKFFTFIFEKIRNNPIGIGVNPLPKNENVEKEKTIVEELCPEILTEF